MFEDEKSFMELWLVGLEAKKGWCGHYNT